MPLKITELRDIWVKEKDSYKIKEVGTGVQTFVQDVLECVALFNLKKGLESKSNSKRKNEFTRETKHKSDGGQADFIIFIDGINIVIPVEVEKHCNIKAGEKQLFRYQLDMG